MNKISTISAVFTVVLFLTANTSNAMQNAIKTNTVVIHNHLHKNDDIMIEYKKAYGLAEATIYTKNLYKLERKTFTRIAHHGNTLPITFCVGNSKEHWHTIDVSGKKELTIKSYQNKNGEIRVGIFNDNDQLIARFTRKH